MHSARPAEAGRMPSRRLTILLPVTSRGPESPSVQIVIEGLKTLAASLHLPQVKQHAPQGSDHTPASHTTSCSSNSNDPLLVLVGVDSDDVPLLQHEQQLCEPFTSAGVSAQVLLFSEADRASHGPGALCHLWGIMAKAAIKEGCDLAVLLGEYQHPELDPLHPTACGWQAIGSPHIALCITRNLQAL